MGARPRPGRHAATELAADVAAPKTGVPALLERVARSVADLNGDTAACVERVPVASQPRRCSVRVRERYTRPPPPKGPYPLGGDGCEEGSGAWSGDQGKGISDGAGDCCCGEISRCASRCWRRGVQRRRMLRQGSGEASGGKGVPLAATRVASARSSFFERHVATERDCRAAVKARRQPGMDALRRELRSALIGRRRDIFAKVLGAKPNETLS